MDRGGTVERHVEILAQRRAERGLETAFDPDLLEGGGK
jgi:hypothetical protein